VNDCFYNYYMEELASWFGIDRPGSVDFWVKAGWKKCEIFDDLTQQFFHPAYDLMVYPVFRGLCMGWSWSLYFANESVNYIVNGMVERPLQEIRDKAPLPSLANGPLTGVYVDNISIIGKTREEAVGAAERVARHFEQAEIPLTWTTPEPCEVFETVGLVLDFRKGTIRNKPKRLWKAFFAGRELLKRRRVSGKLVEVWLGHITSLFMITPCGLSCFFQIYRFVQQHRHHRTFLWGSVREEIKLALGLLWMSSSLLKFDPVYQLDAGDSSSGAYALMTTWASFDELVALCKYREFWRFQPLPISVKQAVATGSRAAVIAALEALEHEGEHCGSSQEVRALPPFGAGLKTRYADWLLEAAEDDSSWLRTSAVRTQLKAKPRKKLEMETPTMAVPVSDSLCRRDRYSLLWRKKWKETKRHINEKEAQVCLTSLKRTARVRKLHGKVKVTLTDNLSCLCALERGRSSSFALNKICRTACAYQMGCGIRWRLRHIETLRNPADRDSRFHEKQVKTGSGCDTSGGCKRVCFPPQPHRNQATVKTDVFPLFGVGGEGSSCSPAQQSELISKRGTDGTLKKPMACKGVFLEIFAGTARLTDALRRQRLATLHPVDCQFGSHHDVRRRATQLSLLAFIRAGHVRYVHVSTPCTVFSKARHFLTNLERARDREHDGVELALFTAEVIETCNRYGVKWSLENPRSSRLFELPFLQRLLCQSGVYRVDLDFCMYGESYKKPTTIFTNVEGLQILAAACEHRRHGEVLRGSEQVRDGSRLTNQPKTKQAGAYPIQLVDKWALCVLELVERKSRDRDILAIQYEYELRCICKKGKARSGAISDGSANHFLCKQLEGIQPEGLKALVFGQHTIEEAEKSRRCQKEQIKEQSVSRSLGERYPTATASTFGPEISESKR
jgi:hypothetical protein